MPRSHPVQPNVPDLTVHGRVTDPVRLLLAYLALVFVGGALLAPWAWTLVQELAPGSALAHQPFRRYVDRCLLGVALLGLWPMARIGWFPGWRSVGLGWHPGARGQLLRGWAGGMLSLAAVAGVAIGFGARGWNSNHPLSLYLLHVARALGAAIAVSFVEELLFRGMILGALRRRYSFGLSALASSVLFAVIHFFRRPDPPDSVGPWTGIGMLAKMLSGLADPAWLLPGFLTLGWIGWILAWCRERTGSLWLPLGLHAGWIFWFKSYQFLTVPALHSGSWAWWWGSTRLHDGWLTLLVLGLTALVLMRGVERTGGRVEPRPSPG